MSEQQSLIEVKRALPAELTSRFDAFLVKAQERLPASEEALETAKQFTIDSDVAFQVADSAQSNLKNEAKAFSEERLELTRPIDDFKNVFVGAEKAAVSPLHEAANTYQVKMSAFRRQEREKAEKAQREAERLLAEQRAKQEAEARRLEEKAAKLKTDAAKQKALAEAENIRTVAAMTPTSITPAQAPQTVASNVAEIWEVEEITDTSAYLRWLADHPEWHCVLGYKTAEHNRMARQFRNVVPVPGVKFYQRDSFRTKAKHHA